MSRASTYPYNENRCIFTEFPLHSRPITMWTKTISDEKNAYSPISPMFDAYYFYNHQAGSADASFYILTQRLRQETLASLHLLYASFNGREQQNSNLDYDLWVDMSPLSIEKVVMRTQDMGQGKPLAILDPLPEE